MHRLRITAAGAALLLAFAATPATAHQGHGTGKKPMGTIESFDGTTLTVTLSDGSSQSATTTDDTRVKVEHRGNHTHGRGHGNPSRGSLDDLQAGNFVLRMKMRGDTLEQIRIRRAPESTDTVCTESDNADAESDGADDECAAPENPNDDATSDDDATDDATDDEDATDDDDSSDDGANSDDDTLTDDDGAGPTE